MYSEERRSKEKLITAEVYTDGSLKKIGKTTFGGWAFVVIRDGQEIFKTGHSELNTTNQRMELTAVVEALKYMQEHRHPNEKVVIYSDSAYLVNCYLQDWYINWERNGWRNAQHKDVANRDLWEQIIPFFDNFWYYFIKVQGHAGNYRNEQCDEIAQDMAERLKIRWRGQNK